MPIIALMLSVLVLFIGLAIDAGNLMGRRAKLQSAVDAAALSGAQMLVTGSNTTVNATNKAYQMLEANGALSNSLSVRAVDFPYNNQIHVRAVQRVPTFFMRIIPMWRTLDISAEATADINSYAEINAKPYGIPGVVNEVNLMVWGVDSRRQNGDAYSPALDRDPNNGGAPTMANPEYTKQPYGYLFRVDVPPSYAYQNLVVQFFDPDSYNRTGAPPTWPTCPPPPSPTPCPRPSNPDVYASCTNPRPMPNPPSSVCTTNSGVDSDPALHLRAFPDPADLSNINKGRPAFWRVDEYRCPYNPSCVNQYQSVNATTTKYSLWHFNPHISSVYQNPTTLSDYYVGGVPAPVATYVVHDDSRTDLSWYQPPGFTVQVKDAFGTPNPLFEREYGGGWYFYLYVQGIGGSSENNYDIRVGPPNSEQANNDACTDVTTVGSTDCYVNQLYYDNAYSGKADWNDGGAKLFAKRALPLNLDTGDQFPPVFTQISKNASGQIIGIRHFDQDCNGAQGCNTPMIYQMQKCGFTDLSDDNTWADVTDPGGNPAIGYVSGNDTWSNSWSNPTRPDTDLVQIPVEGSAAYTTFFGNTGQCQTSWLRIRRYPSYSQDTTVWEMPFLRPRLLK